MTENPTPGPGQPGRPKIRFGQPSSAASGTATFGPAGVAAGLVLIVVVVGGLLWAAASGKPASAQRPALFGGSVVLKDARPLTVINLATASISVRLQGVNNQVGADSYGDVQPVPVQDGTVLVNTRTGSFNFLERDDYVTDPNGPGVGLGSLSGVVGAEGLASGPDAYILRSAPRSTVSLVGRQTVAAAVHATGAVPPLGFAALGGPVGLNAGSAGVSGSALWLLVGSGASCKVDVLQPSTGGRGTLAVTTAATLQSGCSSAAIEAAGQTVAVAAPGRVLLFRSGSTGHPVTVAVPATRAAGRLVPVNGAGRAVMYLAAGPGGWSLLTVDGSGRVTGPFRLDHFGAASAPAPPVLSGGYLYTLDRSQPSAQPNLWTIDPVNGHVAPVAGAPLYPIRSKSEQNSFQGTQVLVDGPRVVFNNPLSLDALVVFTDGSHAPVVVDKSLAVAVSTTGPADLDFAPPTTTPGSATGARNPNSSSQPVPVAQPVSQKVTCANTTQKPYAPQVTSVTPSSDTALIAWSYELLDQTDCEPSSWAVQVTALSGSHQPATPTQVVYGQNQYLFTGLRPATRYSVVVTAYINAQSTPSTATTFTTAPRGPDAPLSVTTTTDGQGDWVVSWKPCTETGNPNCVVPADQWSVIGAACGGSYVGAPPTVQVAGGTDTATINADDLGLLGESLSFSVEGTLVSGLTGNPTSDHSCTQSYRQPDASGISLTGAGAAAGTSITATLQVSASGNPVEDFGTQPSEAEFVYNVDGRTVGPTNNLQVTVPGLPAGQQFTPTVQIYPAGHPEAAVTVTGSPFSQTLPWPADLQGGMSVIPAVGSDPNTGTLTVAFPADLPAGPLTASNVTLTCGSTQIPESNAAVSGGRIGYPIDLVTSGGSCGLALTLVDNASPDPYGGPSPQLNASFNIGTEPTYTFAASVASACQLNFVCGVTGQPYQVQVSSTGGGPLAAGGAWSVATFDGLNLCHVNDNLSGPTFPYVVALPPACPSASSVDVRVTFEYLGQYVTVDAGSPSGGGAPPTTTPTSSPTSSSTTQPCPPASSTTSTTAHATTSTTSGAATTTTTRACTASDYRGDPGTALASSSDPSGTARVDPVARSALGWLFAGLGLLWLIPAARRMRSRFTSEKGRR